MGGCKKGNVVAARTDDLMMKILHDLEVLPEGPKIFVEDLNGTTETFATVSDMLTDQGWTDAGMDSKACKGKTRQHTCHANEKARESRIEYKFPNPWLAPALEECEADQEEQLSKGDGVPASTVLIYKVKNELSFGEPLRRKLNRL